MKSKNRCKIRKTKASRVRWYTSMLVQYISTDRPACKSAYSFDQTNHSAASMVETAVLLRRTKSFAASNVSQLGSGNNRRPRRFIHLWIKVKTTIHSIGTFANVVRWSWECQMALPRAEVVRNWVTWLDTCAIWRLFSISHQRGHVHARTLLLIRGRRGVFPPSCCWWSSHDMWRFVASSLDGCSTWQSTCAVRQLGADGATTAAGLLADLAEHLMSVWVQILFQSALVEASI